MNADAARMCHMLLIGWPPPDSHTPPYLGYARVADFE
jgi:hypothetical protein